MKSQVVFKTPYNNYLYDRNSNEIVTISSEEYGNIESGNPLTEEEYMNMREKGIILENYLKYIEQPESKLLDCFCERKVNFLTLQITQQCNLRCNYCVYSGGYQNRMHSNRVMSEKVAKKSIDFLAEHSIDSTKVHIGFYGGEPLLQFPLIKVCVAYAEQRLAGKNISYGLTTNATLLTREMVTFFAKHKVMLNISLDGDKESHDKNRKFANSEKGSFDLVQEKLFMIFHDFPAYYPMLSFNVVIDPTQPFQNLCDFFRTNELFRNSTISAGMINEQYAYEKSTMSEAFKEEYGYELFKIFLYKLKRLEKEDVSNLFEGYLGDIKKWENRSFYPLGETEHPSGPCIPGIQRLFVDVNGGFYPCEKVDEESDVMKIGSVDEGFHIEKVMKIWNIGQLTSDECKDCWALRMCTACAAVADDRDSFSKEKKLAACQKIKEGIQQMLKIYCMLKEVGYGEEI